jgi:selT/selW/selH-like putative selenoprotein
LAAEISDKFGVTSELVEGDNGIFDVSVDGNLIFSKFDVDRFPDDAEVVRLLSALD